MRRFVNVPRMTVLAVLGAVILLIFAAKLYQLQIYNKDGYDRNLPADTTTTAVTVEAGRGNILDRNGEMLVSSVASFDVILSRDELLSSEDTNGNILSLIHAVEEQKQTYTDTFPVTKAAPFDFVTMTSSQKYRLEAYLDFFDLEHDITASDFIKWLKSHYGIDYTTSLADTRKIIGVRYELECRVIVNLDPYVFVEDASQELISVIKESGCPGVYETTSYVRKYHTKYAAHLLGYIGGMDEEQYAYYSQFGYAINSDVGQDGVEAAFESYLHGSDGSMLVTTTPDGTVVKEQVVRQAESGNNVYLSIDIGLQQVTEDSMATTIAEINRVRQDDEKITGAAVVVTEVGTGQVLACASYPTYDPATLRQNYGELLNAPNAPLYNRATLGNYNPGSTFKMVTAMAGLRSGVIMRDTTVYDTGVYDVYDDFTLACWIYSETGGGHGEMALISAIENSCNYYFCWVGDHMGVGPLTQAAEDFGFGQKTGLEVYESSGTVPSAENKRELLDESWYAADTLLASIGQGVNYYTPVQLANYVATIADGGTRYKMTLLSRVTSGDYKTLVYSQTPQVAYTFSEKDRTYYIPMLKEGMELVATSGSAASVFRYFPISVGCKTGTTQSDISTSNSGVFVCYAPADDPKIAVAVVVEKGISGSTVMSIAADILTAYFHSEEKAAPFVPVEGELVR